MKIILLISAFILLCIQLASGAPYSTASAKAHASSHAGGVSIVYSPAAYEESADVIVHRGSGGHGVQIVQIPQVHSFAKSYAHSVVY
uniref:Uncharacterized protein n=1 Tax=Anopheles merus TaxID=30066 RepID=A0A182UVN9_ANOME